MVKRSSKQIATDVTTDKYQTPTYFKQPPYWVRRSRILWISMTAFGAFWLGVSFIGGGWVGSWVPYLGESVFMNGPLIDPHAGLAQDCGKCHATPFSHVQDRDCLLCHSKTILAQAGAAAHHPWEEWEMAACSSCHTEHQGDFKLTEIEDRHCAVCHAELPEDSGARAVGFASIPDDHPEIGAVRLSGEGQPDPGRLRFNHKIHLTTADGGVLTGAKEDIHSKKILHCEDCHTLDDHGEYMNPIVHEEHCAGCHAHIIHPLEEGTQVPHDSPSGVREFLLHHFYAHPPGPSDSAPSRRRYVDDEKEFEKSVRAAVDRVERILYRTGSEERCAQCHELVAGSTSTVMDLQPLPDITNPEVLLRWMEHARFNHKAHIQVKCEECHGNVAQSEKSDDILFTSISGCADCHSPRGEASANCALCHTFHPEIRMPGPQATEPASVARNSLGSNQGMERSTQTGAAAVSEGTN